MSKAKTKATKPKPELTFTTQELKCLRDYMNFVNMHGEFKVRAPQMQEFMKLTTGSIHVLKKCERHIFEITEHHPAPEED